MDYTPNYNLIQFEGSDKPSWLGSWNQTMLAIDTAIHGNAVNIADGVTKTTEAQTTATSALTQANANKIELESQGSMIETLQDDVQNLNKIQIDSASYTITTYGTSYGQDVTLFRLNNVNKLILVSLVKMFNNMEVFGTIFNVNLGQIGAAKANIYNLPIQSISPNVPFTVYLVGTIITNNNTVPVWSVWDGTNTYIFSEATGYTGNYTPVNGYYYSTSFTITKSPYTPENFPANPG